MEEGLHHAVTSDVPLIVAISVIETEDYPDVTDSGRIIHIRNIVLMELLLRTL